MYGLKRFPVLFLLPLLLLAEAAKASPSAVTDNIDWSAFLGRLDMVWNRLPDQWGDGAFMGNGLLGANVFTTPDGKSLMWRIGRTDVTLAGDRIPIGELVLNTVGRITGGSCRLDLWNAELRGTIKTTSGQVDFRSFTHSEQLIQLIELRPSEGEANCRFTWHPSAPNDPRLVYQKKPIPKDQRSPATRQSSDNDLHICEQPLYDGAEHATVWKVISSSNHRRVILLSVGFSKDGSPARDEAVNAVSTAAVDGADALTSTHRDWWHHYWPESFLSIPDTRLEAFYWIQMYKLASGTRADRPALDLMGPWFNTTPWPRLWWNLNVQLTYWPVLTSNRLELGESLCRMIDKTTPALEVNARGFSSDSYAIGRSCSYDCVRPVEHEICDLPWALDNYYLQYRYSMDDAMLRDHLFPLLKGTINYYLHLLKRDPDGYLHISDGYSPEYPNQPTPNPDCNIDLALLRWGCQTLLDICGRLEIDDPQIPRWKQTLDKLVPYPVDENGLRISASVPMAVSHRHYSHLLMIYPLYLMDPAIPANRALIRKSLDHWMSMPKGLRGFSFTGAASIAAELGAGDEALGYLQQLLNTKIHPNTMYTEAGPVIETPLSAAASLHDMLLTSWGGKIRVFPAVPAAWHEVTFHNLRAQGAFLVTAVRKDDKTQFIQIQSLMGEPCVLVTSMPHPASHDVMIHMIAQNEYQLDLHKGQTALLTSNGAAVDCEVAPVPDQKEFTNFYGLH